MRSIAKPPMISYVVSRVKYKHFSFKFKKSALVMKTPLISFSKNLSSSVIWLTKPNAKDLNLRDSIRKMSTCEISFRI